MHCSDVSIPTFIKYSNKINQTILLLVKKVTSGDLALSPEITITFINNRINDLMQQPSIIKHLLIILY